MVTEQIANLSAGNRRPGSNPGLSAQSTSIGMQNAQSQRSGYFFCVKISPEIVASVHELVKTCTWSYPVVPQFCSSSNHHAYSVFLHVSSPFGKDSRAAISNAPSEQVGSASTVDRLHPSQSRRECTSAAEFHLHPQFKKESVFADLGANGRGLFRGAGGVFVWRSGSHCLQRTCCCFNRTEWL